MFCGSQKQLQPFSQRCSVGGTEDWDSAAMTTYRAKIIETTCNIMQSSAVMCTCYYVRPLYVFYVLECLESRLQIALDYCTKR